MRRTLGAAMLLMLATGCATGPVVESSVPPPPGVEFFEVRNPMYVPLSGPTAYNIVFENVLKVIHDMGFELREHNRYDGRIETLPRISPGIGLPLSPGSSEFSERLLATFQTYRQRASVQIQPAENGGFFIYVIVYKELEDLPRPVRSTAGAVLYNRENSVDRQFEVIDPTIFESNWIPKGRDAGMERVILERLRELM